MKWLVGIAGIVLIGWMVQLRHPSATKTPADKHASFALLELFTSEGCSSCPSADRLLPQLAKDSNVIVLSFHVDYWDRLGWKDRFSDAAYTERQRTYASRLGLESIYTPQLIINGRHELVGSNEAGARQYIAQAKNDTPSVEIRIDEIKENGNHLDVRCHLEGDIRNTQLLSALVERSADTQVGGGENRGVKLVHTNVVRSFSMQKAASQMQLSVIVPKDLSGDKRRLILYTQRDDLRITGAVSL